jgi:hypothetical protein
VRLQVSRGVSPLPVAVKCRRRHVRVRAARGFAPALRAGHDEHLFCRSEIEFKFIGRLISIPLIGTVPEGIRVFTGRHRVSKIRLDMDDFYLLSAVFIDRLPSSEGKKRQIHKLPNARLEMCQLPFPKVTSQPRQFAATIAVRVGDLTDCSKIRTRWKIVIIFDHPRRTLVLDRRPGNRAAILRSEIHRHASHGCSDRRCSVRAFDDPTARRSAAAGSRGPRLDASRAGWRLR